MSAVSVIIPTFNREAYIQDTIASVQNQTSRDWECIVVDDGSTDMTISLVEAFSKADSRITLYHRPKNRPKGANACRNIGIEHATGDYLMFLDSDDLLSNTCIQDRMRLIQESGNPEAAIFPMERFYLEAGDKPGTINKELIRKKNYLDMFLSYQIPWPITSMFIRKETLNITFNEQLARYQDVDFGIRLLLNSTTKPIVFNHSKVDCFYRIQRTPQDTTVNYNFINRINNSLFLFFMSIIPKLKQQDISQDRLQQLEQFYRHTYKTYILPNIHFIDTTYARTRNLLYKENILSFKQYAQYTILEKMYLKNWDKKKGTGTYRLTKKWLS